MASGRTERAAVDWEVGPTRDVVNALIEAFVDPKLHSMQVVSSDDPLFEVTEKSIAKQMHAVVLLYNYYHRKQKPELKFLDYESFSELAMSLKISLIPFMKATTVGIKDQLSATEKAIKDACNIAMSLDASKDSPIVDGHPISKVAVLLIDSKKENCFLQFGAITEGVWSLLEKEINEETLAAENVFKKRKTNNQKALPQTKYLQFGYDVVKDVLGIESSELVVLETHVVYSLSKDGSAAQFYIMQCPQSFNIKQSVPLKYLTESLNGPLAENFLGSWSTTEIVKYLHILPYVGFISDWFQRKDSCLPTLNGHNAPSKTPSLPLPVPSVPVPEPSVPLPEYNVEKIDRISSEATENSEDNQEKNNHSSGGKDVSSVECLPSTNERADILQARKTRITRKKLDKDGGKHESGLLSGPTRRLTRSAAREDNAQQRMKMGDSTRSSVETGEGKKVNSKPGASHQRKENESSHQGQENVTSAQHDSPFPDGANLKVQNPDPASLCRDENITAEKVTTGSGDVDTFCNQSGTATKKKLVQTHNIEAENALSPKHSVNALALLERRRQEVHSKICAMEDKLASYEHSIERVRAGGETEFARKCINHIINGSDNLLSKNGLQGQDKSLQPGDDRTPSQKKTGFSCTYLPGQSSCRDLELICDNNDWRLPRYFVQPVDDKFISNVVVQSKDFSLSSTGSSECSPHEARESAAAQMIAKIRDKCANQS